MCNEEAPFRRIANMAVEELGEEIKKMLHVCEELVIPGAMRR
ncbi:MAG: hypothetical protein ACO2PN_17605 [Pyrobaculum sp.]